VKLHSDDDVHFRRGKVNVPPLTPETKAEVERVLKRAQEDAEYRELLLLNPVEALRDVNLGPAEKNILGRMKRVQLEEWGIDMREHRARTRDNGNKVNAA
jgi:hypothetical protein